MVRKRFKILVKFKKRELEFLKVFCKINGNHFHFEMMNGFSYDEYFEICSELIRKGLLLYHSYDCTSKTICGIKLSTFGKQLIKQL